LDHAEEASRVQVMAAPFREKRIEQAIGQIESWQLAIQPWELGQPDYCDVGHEHRIGASGDERVWAFAVTWNPLAESLDPLHETRAAPRDGIQFVLVDPPERDRETISELFFSLHLAAEEPGFGQEKIDEVVASTPFPELRTVRRYLPEAPEPWLDLRVQLSHGFELSENAGIVPEVYNAYRRDSLEGALQTVCGERQEGILVGYSLCATDVVPLLAWNVDWPLSRRGKEEPEPRGKVQGQLPWEEGPDTGLISVYQSLPAVGIAFAPSYWAKPTVRLMVGGRTRDEAIANWNQCARALRKIKRRLVIPAGSPLSW